LLKVHRVYETFVSLPRNAAKYIGNLPSAQGARTFPARLYLEQALEQLRPSQRPVVILPGIQGYKHTEFAKMSVKYLLTESYRRWYSLS